MTSKDELRALAERVMALTGPDRETDRAIELALMPERAFPCPTVELLAYTASLDAAMTLIGEGCESETLHSAMISMPRGLTGQAYWQTICRYVTATALLARAEMLP